MILLDLDLEALKEIHNLLSLSAGYQVSIEDELKYFDSETARSWVRAQDVNGRNLGFIRSFPQGSNWSQGELYVDPSCTNRREVIKALIESFKNRVHFSGGHRLRFDTRIRDTELNEEIEAYGFSQTKQVFLHFEKAVFERAKKSIYSKPTLNHVREIAETLSYLKPVDEVQVRDWVNSDSIRGVFHQAKVVSAAQISKSNDAIEIVRIATHGNLLRRGFATQLISQIIQEASDMGKSFVYLKVEDNRDTALSAYQKAGFVENNEKSQIWHSRWY